MSIWTAMTMLTGSLITGFLFFRYVWILGLPPLANLVILAGFLSMGVTPLFTSYRFENLLGSFYPFYRYSLYFIFVGCVVLLGLTLFFDAAWLVAHKAGWIECLPYSKESCLRYNLFIIGLAVCCTFYALYAGTKVPEIKEITVASPKITSPRTAILLSDLHIHRVLNPDKIKGIIRRTNAQNPDIILLSGDILDDNVRRIAATTALLKGLKAKDGIYFVTGNHEFYAGYQPTINELKKLGFRFLENNGVDLNDIWLAGVPDLTAGGIYGRQIKLASAFAGAAPHQFRLLMSHTPTDFGGNTDFDLEVSGHTHGGQIFPFHIFAWLHNRYLTGMYRLNRGASLYVSNGAGQWGPQMRFLAPSEITVIKLVPQPTTKIKTQQTTKD